MKCKHKWKRSGFGNDLICEKCGYAAMQATMPLMMPATESASMPIAREKMEVPVWTGDGTARITVYKDEFEAELKRKLGIDITHNMRHESLKMGG